MFPTSGPRAEGGEDRQPAGRSRIYVTNIDVPAVRMVWSAILHIVKGQLGQV